MEESNNVVVVTRVYGDICIRKARRKRQKLLVRELVYDYAKNTTLHGLPYVTRKGFTTTEKMFWLITFFCSVSLCLYLINQLWIKLQSSQIITVSEGMVPVSTVPFPSVTICPQSKCKATVYNYTAEKFMIDTFLASHSGTINSTMKKRISKIASLSTVCKLKLYHNIYGFSDSEIYPNEYSGSSIFNDTLDVAPNYEDVFAICKLHGKLRPCDELFNRALTSEGICYSMNSLAADEILNSKSLQKDYQYLYARKTRKGWSVNKGYDGKFNYSTYYPLPGVENGASPDVEVVLTDISEDRDHICNGDHSGFKVYIQHPADLPQSSLYYYAVINDQVSSIALSVSVLNTSKSFSYHRPDVRQCYFSDERSLKYFQIYTTNNCRIECLSNITYEMCGCVELYMPHETGIKICTEEDSQCIDDVQEKLLQESVTDGVRCHCLPSCNSVYYEAEILKTNYNLKEKLEVYRRMGKNGDSIFEGENLSRLEMYFKRPHFLSMRRSESFTAVDFLANCGGVLGLCLGFSFLSLIEILYYLSLRLCCTLKKDLEEEKAQTTRGKEIHIDKF